ncbi:MAG: hypothetical protein MMC33_004021 [Icmadophila ericetorum]|nr:hypothetical protein [Icmadophila ericetorum]
MPSGCATFIKTEKQCLDGDGGEARIAAPPPAGLQNLTASSALCLLETQDTYTAQTGVFEFKTAGVTAMTFHPTVGTLNANNGHLIGLGYDQHTFTTPQDGSDSGFAKAV